jgi:hypothetical protein
MTRDDIIRMAQEHFGAVLKPTDLEVKLAVLAVEAEREACAKLAGPHLAGRIAAAIRARGKT